MNKQLKLLIADDEWRIREGIRESVDWESFNIVVVDEAEDGEITLELAVKYEIDILLIDLNMPIMNGISVVKQLRETLPNCKVIIITGFDEFKFAQEALRLGVDEYLLKPVLPETLKGIIQRISEEVQTRSSEVIFNKIALNYINTNQIEIREQFCLDWVTRKLSDEKLEELLQFFQLPLEAPKQIAMVKCRELQMKQPLVEQNDKPFYISAIKNIILEFLPDINITIFSEKSGLIFIISWVILDENILLKCENAIHKALNISARIYTEEIVNKNNDIVISYNSLKNNTFQQDILIPIVQRAQKYIKENYKNKNVTLEYVANYLQVSPVYLSRIFKKELGTTFISYLTNLRMKKAIKLLNSTDLKINEIASIIGYDSQHYFSTSFKKYIGISPNQYRKNI